MVSRDLKQPRMRITVNKIRSRLSIYPKIKIERDEQLKTRLVRKLRNIWVYDQKVASNFRNIMLHKHMWNGTVYQVAEPDLRTQLRPSLSSVKKREVTTPWVSSSSFSSKGKMNSYWLSLVGFATQIEKQYVFLQTNLTYINLWCFTQ